MTNRTLIHLQGAAGSLQTRPDDAAMRPEDRQGKPPPRSREPREQVKLLRDIIGNPFRAVTIDPSWRTEAVVGLAAGMYESRNFSPMPVLADALEDAGCTSPDLLAHCRKAGPHARGCWVVDLVFGRL